MSDAKVHARQYQTYILSVANCLVQLIQQYDLEMDFAQKQGKKLTLSLGYSHPVEMEDPEGIETVLDGQNIIIVKGISKEKVTQSLCGTLKVFGCPAEEGGSGKTYMARAGVFDGIDIALTWHPSTMNAAERPAYWTRPRS